MPLRTREVTQLSACSGTVLGWVSVCTVPQGAQLTAAGGTLLAPQRISHSVLEQQRSILHAVEAVTSLAVGPRLAGGRGFAQHEPCPCSAYLRLLGFQGSCSPLRHSHTERLRDACRFDGPHVPAASLSRWSMTTRLPPPPPPPRARVLHREVVCCRWRRWWGHRAAAVRTSPHHPRGSE